MERNKEQAGVIAGLFIEQMLSRKYELISIPKNNIMNVVKESDIKQVFIEADIYEIDHEWYSEQFQDLMLILSALNVEIVFVTYENRIEVTQGYKQLIIQESRGNSIEYEGNLYYSPYIIDEYIYNPKDSSKMYDLCLLNFDKSSENTKLLELTKSRKLKTIKINISEIDRNIINQIVTQIKKAKILYIHDNKVLPRQLKKYIELISILSNTLVIFEKTVGENPRYALVDDNATDIIYFIQALIENKMFFDKTIISKTREIFMNNTFIFLNENNVSKPSNYSEIKSKNVSVLIATKRKEFISDFIDQTNSQLNVNLQIVLITHGFELTKKETKELSKHSDYPIDIIYCREDISFGNCLNEGMKFVKHDYVIKMDDDDYYFPHFIIDILIGLEYSQEILVGKYGFFFYLEQSNLIGQRRMHKQYQHVSEIKGNTLLCKSETMREYGYNDISRHVDSDFIKRIKDDGGKIYCIHPYDMCVYRAADKEGHTYQVDDSRFLRDANILYNGKPNKTISSENIF